MQAGDSRRTHTTTRPRESSLRAVASYRAQLSDTLHLLQPVQPHFQTRQVIGQGDLEHQSTWMGIGGRQPREAAHI